MKRKIVIMILGVAILLSGCGSRSANLQEPSNSAESSTIDQTETNSKGNTEPEESVFPGNYTVPDGWVKWDEYSTEEKVFYVEDGQGENEYPDNISVNFGTNRYSAKEHERFRDAIVQQLLAQLEGVDAQLNGDGTYTEQGYILYIFTIDEQEAVTKQYYVVNDYEYCLVHVTNFSKSESVYEAAQSIVDSLVWDG